MAPQDTDRFKPKEKATHGRRYFKRAHRKVKYGREGNKGIFRPGKAYGVKPSPFPARLVTRMKYSFGATLDTATTIGLAGTEEQFQLNALNQPWYNAPGVPDVNKVTVVGLPEMSTLYNKYIVYGAKIEVTFSNPSQDGIVGICSLNQWSQAGANYVRHINEDALTYTTEINNTGSQKRTMNFYVPVWSAVGLSKLEYLANKSTHSSSVTANPTSAPLLRVCIANTQDVTGATMRVDIRIYYYTTFFERKQLNSSASA